MYFFVDRMYVHTKYSAHYNALSDGVISNPLRCLVATIKTFKYELTINQIIKNRVLQKDKMIDYSDVKSNFKKLLSPATLT